MKCAKCKIEFEPFKRNGIILSKLCTGCLIEKAKYEKQKQWKKKKSVMKDDLKTHKDWLKDLQRVFNTYIRTRDYGKPCISCNRMLRDNFDAGHLFTVGAYPNIRFNEDNVHGQCVHCNQHLHGAVSEYMINLPARIGQERFDKLLSDRNISNKLTVSEIKDSISYYKMKTKEIESKRNEQNLLNNIF